MKVRSTLTSRLNHHEVVVHTNGNSRPVSITHKASSFGSAVNGGELLTLAIATCFCNDLYREAAKRNIHITSVEVEASGEFNAEGGSGENIIYTAKVVADASPEEIDELIRHTDTVAEVHNTLRKGATVRLLH
ncbi:MAG: OsmC family protein [Flavisolibacter sp.]